MKKSSLSDIAGLRNESERREDLTHGLDLSRRAYSMREAAQAVGVCERSIWQAIKDGRLKAAKIGRSVRIRSEELDRFLRESEI